MNGLEIARKLTRRRGNDRTGPGVGNSLINVSLLATVFIFVFLSGGCLPHGSVALSIDNLPPLAGEARPYLEAGAANIDITPPPGMPMAGFAVDSCNGKGVRTRLRARVIYLKPAKGKPVALVSADMLSGSRLLHHKVAQLIAQKTDIESGGLMLAGTHTHSAPGNYFSSGLYNMFASNKTGFCYPYFDFLSRRIAGGVVEAYRGRGRARIATGKTQLRGVTVNRSFPAYLRNPDKTADNKFDAVNPDLFVIRVDKYHEDPQDNRKGFKPLAVFTLYSIHPNTMPIDFGHMYSGDVTAYIQREMENQIKGEYPLPWNPVHVVANLTHGDNNSYYGENVKETQVDLRRVGKVIADKGMEVFRALGRGPFTEKPNIGYRAREIDVYEDDGNCIDGVCIAKRPRIGLANLAGARGRETFVSKIPCVREWVVPGEPKTFNTGGEHGHKRIAGGKLLQSFILPKKKFPHHLFIQVIRVHDMVLLPMPWEVSYQLGLRVSAYAAQKAGDAGMRAGHFPIVGCGNGYWGYVTTPEEYGLQYYEGGSTLYGPNTGEFIKLHWGRLVDTLARQGTGQELPAKWEKKLGKASKKMFPKEVAPGAARRVYREPQYHEGQGGKESYWSFLWQDVRKGSLQLHEPLILIEARESGGGWETVADDQGGETALLHVKKLKSRMALYEARWYGYGAAGGSGRQYRFVILPRHSFGKLTSGSF